MNEVEIVVTGDNRTGPMWTQLRAQLDALKKDVATLHRNLRGLPDPKLTTDVDDTAVTALDVKLNRVRRVRVKVDVDGGGGLGGLRGLAGGGLASLGDLGKNLRGAQTPILAGVATNVGVAASPIIGAGANAAGLGAIGGAGLALGIAGAFQDPAVKRAAVTFGDDMKDIMLQAGRPFIEPVKAGIREIGREIGALDLTAMVAPLAGSIKPLVEGVRGMIREVGPGLSKALEASGPVIDVLSRGLPKIGAAISSMFESFAAGSEGAGRFMEDMVTWISATIRFLGNMVEALSNVYTWFDKVGTIIGAIARGDIQGIGRAIMDAFGDNPRTAVYSMTGATEGATDAMQDAAGAARQLAGDYDALMGHLFGIKDAQMAVEEAMDEFGEAIKENGKNWDIGTEGGRENTRALRAAEEAIRDFYNACIEQGDAPAVAAMKARALAETLYRQAAAAGASAAELAALRKIIEGMPTGTRTLNYNVNNTTTNTVRSVFSRQAMAHGGITGAASGGARGGDVWVGEQGPELVSLPYGSTVHTAGQSKAMAERAGGIGRGVMAEVSAAPGATEAIVDLIIEYLRVRVRDRAGGDPVAFLQQA